MARQLRTLLDGVKDGYCSVEAIGFAPRVISHLDAELKPKRSIKLAKVRRTSKRLTKKEETAKVYSWVENRAAGKCEACGMSFSELVRPELDHFAGRIRVKQSPDNCWMLGTHCHKQKTLNLPSAEYWLEKFISHCDRWGIRGEAREMAQRRLDSLKLQNQMAIPRSI